MPILWLGILLSVFRFIWVIVMSELSSFKTPNGVFNFRRNAKVWLSRKEWDWFSKAGRLHKGVWEFSTLLAARVSLGLWLRSYAFPVSTFILRSWSLPKDWKQFWPCYVAWSIKAVGFHLLLLPKRFLESRLHSQSFWVTQPHHLWVEWGKTDSQDSVAVISKKLGPVFESAVAGFCASPSCLAPHSLWFLTHCWIGLGMSLFSVLHFRGFL